MNRSKILRATAFVTFCLTGLIQADVVITTDTVQDGGVLTVDPIGALAVHGATEPQLTLTNGATWTGVYAVVVGTQESGDGHMRIDSGSAVVVEHVEPHQNFDTYDGINLYPGDAHIGLGEGSSGTLVVHGAGTTWYNKHSLVLAGFANSHAEVNVEAGALLRASNLYMAQNPNTSASMTVTGAGSKLRLQSASIGNGGTANMLIDAGGMVESIGFGAELANDVNTHVSLVIRGVGSNWTEYTGMSMGFDGEADVRVEGGGQLWVKNSVQNSAAFIGDWVGHDGPGTAAFTITGAGSTFRANRFFVGRESTLIAEQAGRILGNGVVGNGDAAPGSSVTIRGPGSRWDGDAFISRTATLLVELGGEINSIDASAFHAIVKDTSSAWNVADELKIEAEPETASDVLIQNNATLTVNGSTTIESNATLTIDHANFTRFAGNATAPITGGGRLKILNGSSVHFQSANIDALEVSGADSLARGGTSKFRTMILTSGGRFSTYDDGVIITGMSEAEVTQLVANGYNNGAWDGVNGIGSTLADNDGYAIGVASNNTTGTWLGLPISPTDQMIAATLAGDTDLSFSVNFTDLLVVAQHYNTSGDTTWDEGDFNYDNQTDFNDLLAVAQNYGLSALSDGSITIDQSLHSRFDSDWQSALMGIPEPTSLMLLGAVAIVLSRRAH